MSKALTERYRFERRDVPAGGRRWSMLHLTEVDALLDELMAKDPDHPDRMDEKFPYWAEIWPSSVALASAIADPGSEWRGIEAVELGCGPGLAGLSALDRGARVLFTDWMDEALELTRLNVRHNLGREAEVLAMDWRRPLEGRRFDRILAADCTYEARFFDDVIRCFGQLLRPDGEVWLAEPGRSVAAEFFLRLARADWRAEPVPGIPDGIRVWRIRR